MATSKASGAPSFLMKGKRARSAWKRANTEHKSRQEEIDNRVYRFYMRTGDEAKITFLTGKLDADGILDVPLISEHNLHLHGHYRNWFRCTDHGGDGSEPCPICEGGDSSYVAGVFTIMDHTKWKDRKNVWHEHEIKLYIVKREGLNLLQRYATKRGGLVGTSWEVGRAGDNSPNTGNSFDFLSKNSPKKLVEVFGKKGITVKPIDYKTALPYYDAAELRKRGFGGSAPVGSEDDWSSDDDDDGLDGIV